MQCNTDLDSHVVCSSAVIFAVAVMAEGDAPDGPGRGKDSEASQDAAHTADASTGPGTPAADSEPAPLREDQIQNAMAFLSHPKVCLMIMYCMPSSCIQLAACMNQAALVKIGGLLQEAM